MSHNPDDLLFEPVHPDAAAQFLRKVRHLIIDGEAAEAIEMLAAIEHGFLIDAAFVEKQNRYPHPEH